MSAMSMFTEANGKTSSIRVQSFMVLVVTLGVFVVGHFEGKPLDLGTLALMLLFAFAPKAAQRFAETRVPKEQPKV